MVAFPKGHEAHRVSWLRRAADLPGDHRSLVHLEAAGPNIRRKDVQGTCFRAEI